MHLPYNILIHVLRHATNCEYIDQFFERRSPQSREHYHKQVHAYIASKNPALLCVSRAWRHAALPYYFRYALCNEASAVPVNVPPAHQHLLHGLFVCVPLSHKDIRWQEQPPFAAIPHGIRENTKLLGVWMYNNMGVPLEYMCFINAAFPHLQSTYFDMELHSVLTAEQHSYQHAIAKSALGSPALSEALCQLHTLTFHRLLDTTPSHLFKLVQQCAPFVKHMDIGLVSGSVLSRIFFATHSRQHTAEGSPTRVTEQVLFPQLRRLHYSLTSGVAQKYPPVTACIFPSIEELFCDNLRSADAVVNDQAYMALHDLFLALPLPKLRALKFNFKFDPHRPITDQQRHPRLQTLELFDHAYWCGSSLSSDQAASMLGAALSHPSLTSFGYPAAVSGTVPIPKVECSEIRFLMLKGWTFSVESLIDLVQQQPQLASLQINVAPGLSAAIKRPKRMHGGGHSLRHLWLFSDRCNDKCWDSARLGQLFDLLDNLSRLEQLFLFPRAAEELRQLAALASPRSFALGQDAPEIAELCAVAQKVSRIVA
ncbi:hypothetical protein FBU59_001676 [Linderina macrospora]|uniref:Uncharacterized protein n=1 Tax=Linderina macrospora TaxID=4868 RepID=A0ACC1JDD9_9FUNG|nr:hypothetical protein FBU59_001676 [Linderina macrospora]